MDRLTTIKAAVSAAAAALTAFWGWTGWLAAAWFLAMLLDYATGSAAALRAGTWSSRCAREGLWHQGGQRGRACWWRRCWTSHCGRCSAVCRDWAHTMTCCCARS